LTDNRIISFPSDGATWRLDWLGDIRYRREVRWKEPFIQVALSSVQLDSSGTWSYPDRFEASPAQVSAVVPVGMLALLRVGTIWTNGVMVEDPVYTEETFSVRAGNDTTTLIKAGLANEDESFILPFEAHPYHRGHTQSYCVQVLLDDGARLIVPTVEMARFYFGSSSNLIKKLFLVPFQETRLWNRATRDADGVADIDLVKGISGVSAADIARIALDPKARQAASLISKSLTTSSNQGDKSYPKTLFPFPGSTKLAVRGIWLAGTNPRTFLAFQILSCSHRFPFSGLRYTMSRKQSTRQPSGSEGNTRSTVETVKQDHRQQAIRQPMVNDPPDTRKSPKAKPLASKSRFPDLDYKSVLRIDPMTPMQIIVTDAGELAAATSVGAGEGKTGIQPVELVAAKNAPKPERHPLEKTTFAAVVDRIVRKLITQRKRVSFIPLDPRQRFPQFSVMPEIVTEDGEILPLSLIEQDGTTRSRYVSVLYIANSFPFPDEGWIIPEIEAAKGPEAQESAVRKFSLKEKEDIDARWVGVNMAGPSERT
jgi:hypothetical protein